MAPAGLRPLLPETMSDAYGIAILRAARESGLPEQAFPIVCPWDFKQALDESFLPA
jgi:hypothetical protein